MSKITNIQLTGMTPGHDYKINVLVSRDDGAGFSPKIGSAEVGGITKQLKVGFYLVNEGEIGELIDRYPKEVAIAFRPKLYGEATIYFFASTGEIIRFGIMATEVHDHASILTGGPAYGTYYSDLSGLEATQVDE